MRRRTLAVALAAALFGLIAESALAQDAKPKPTSSAGAPTVMVDRDELAQGRSRPAASGRERLGKLEKSARRVETDVPPSVARSSRVYGWKSIGWGRFERLICSH